MNALQQELIFDHHEQPTDVRAEAVEQMLACLKSVVSEKPSNSYEILPVQVDALEVAAIVTGARTIEGNVGSYYHGFYFSRGFYNGEPVEFAQEYSRMERADEQPVMVAWGVRRVKPEQIYKEPKNIPLPSAIFGIDEQEIARLKVRKHAELPHAA